MKRINTFIMISLICVMSIGCSSGEIQVLKEQNASLEKQVAELEEQKQKPSNWYKGEEASRALKLLDGFIEDNGAELGIAEADTLQVIRLDKISDRYYLAQYTIDPQHVYINLMYAIVDMEKDSCKQINLDSVDYINDITYDKDFIIFHCDGRNLLNGFRDFPNTKKYDIARNEVITEYLNKSLRFSESEILLGNGVKMGLGKVSEENKEIRFDFTETAGGVMAGGMFCPTIRTGLKQDDNQEDRTLYVDFENIVLSKEAQQQIMDLKQLEYISDISIRSYTDVHDDPHVAVYYKFKGVQEYSCRFREDSSNGFMDFVLMLK